MKRRHSMAPLISLLFIGLFLSACSTIKIKQPERDGERIWSIDSLQYDILVKEEGCGTPIPDTFKAWIDKEEITSVFSYSDQAWIAENFKLPVGNHTLKASADVNTGAWCIKGKLSDTRTFYVGDEYLYYAAEMKPQEVKIAYRVNGFGEYSLRLRDGENVTIYPGSSPIKVEYSLIRSEDANRPVSFESFIYYKNKSYDPQPVDLRETNLESIHHNARFPLNSQGVMLIMGNLRQTPIGDDALAIFFRANLRVKEQFYCPDGKECCEPRADGSCGSCMPICP